MVSPWNFSNNKMTWHSLIQSNQRLVCVVGDRSYDLCLALLKVVETIGRSSAEVFRQQEPSSWTVGDLSHSNVYFQFSAGGYETSGKSYTLVDFPTSANAMKMLATGAFGSSNQIAGTPIVSAVILAINVENGLTTNLIQVAELATAIGVRPILAFIDQPKSLDDVELIEMCQIEVSEGIDIDPERILTGNTELALDRQVINYSTPEFQPIINLIELLNQSLGPHPNLAQRPLFAPIYQVDDQKDETSILTCQVKQGTLFTGQAVDIIGFGDRIRTECIRVREQNTDDLLTAQVYAEPGWVRAGQCITTPKKMRSYVQFSAVIYALTVEEAKLHLPLVDQDEILVSFWSLKTAARLIFGKEDSILSPSVDDEIKIGIGEFLLEESVPLDIGSSFEVYKMEQLVAIGTVTKTID